VAIRYGFRSGVKAKGCSGLGVQTVRLEPGGDFFVEGAGAKASRLPRRSFRAFSESLPIPADASGASRLDPQATTKLEPGPPSRNGYPGEKAQGN